MPIEVTLSKIEIDSFVANLIKGKSRPMQIRHDYTNTMSHQTPNKPTLGHPEKIAIMPHYPAFSMLLASNKAISGVN